jgi:hypothetical protein
MILSESILTRLRYQHKTIGELIDGIPEDQIRFRPDPAKWSVFENIAHLACYQPVFLDRIDKILAGSSPSFTRYTAEQDPSFPTYLEMPLSGLLADLEKKRHRILQQLSAMGERQLALTGIHPRFGLLTLTSWTEFFLLHEAHHLYTIFILVRVTGSGNAAGSGNPPSHSTPGQR